MGRKTTAYARKRLRQNAHTFNGAEWANVVQRCRVFTDEPIVPGLGWGENGATKADILVTDALNSLLAHETPADVERNFDLLAHALGVAAIRALQINPDQANNPALPILRAGSDALERAIDRYQRIGKWGLDGPGRLALPDAVDVYREILHASSPAQMEKATEERIRVLDGRRRAPLEGVRV